MGHSILACPQVPAAHIWRLDLTPEIDNGTLVVTVQGSKAAQGLGVRAIASSNGVQVGVGQGVIGQRFVVPISSLHLW